MVFSAFIIALRLGFLAFFKLGLLWLFLALDSTQAASGYQLTEVQYYGQIMTTAPTTLFTDEDHEMKFKLWKKPVSGRCLKVHL